MSDHSSRPTRLLTLGAAAVVSIYAAGFDRTRPAAQRLAEEDAAHRRPPAEVRVVAEGPVVATPERSDTVRPVELAPAPVAPDAATTKPAATVAVSPAAPVVASAAVVASAPARDTAPVSTPVTAPAAVPAPAEPPVTDTATTVVAAPKWRDGTYSGWGNSRHGSIEATVTIRGGRIAEAYISRCETRYSCSWIEHLQIQVVDRQGPEVDFVSGATQSVNAFYYAVVEALNKAK